MSEELEKFESVWRKLHSLSQEKRQLLTLQIRIRDLLEIDDEIDILGDHITTSLLQATINAERVIQDLVEKIEPLKRTKFGGLHGH